MRGGVEAMDWTEFSTVFGTVGPTVVALAVVILNRRDRLADKVNELSERVARIEGILVKEEI
ncbi:MAG: hypothetical protein OXD34_06035 [bacterium]|nr:hypothetical protein [bacterium]